MKTSLRLLPFAALAALVSTTSAQSFNIDVGDQAAPYGLPSSAYGAGAAQPGSWFAADPTPGTPQTLTDLTGAITSVTINHTGGFGAFDSNASANLTGDDEALMCDIQDVGNLSGSTTWTISNLSAGNYALYSYAWAPDSSAFVSGVAGGTIDPNQNVGGAWPGSQALGITYARHRFIVAAGGSIAVTITAVSGFASVNGFQLVRTDTPTTPFCFGDGSGTACPCGNSGAAGNGCANSVNASGANVAGTGNASIGADTFLLSGTGMPNSSALYFQGTTQTSTAFGDGLRCAGGTVIRLGTKTNSGGASQYPVAGDATISVRGLDSAGDVRTYQCWYRNADPTFCTSATFNLTNGVLVTWIP